MPARCVQLKNYGPVILGHSGSFKDAESFSLFFFFIVFSIKTSSQTEIMECESVLVHPFEHLSGFK